MKYAKTVMQLEKGLPPNSVVPILKDKVEGMRHKVLDQQQLSLYPRSRRDLCLLRGNSSKRGCEGLSVIVFHNLQSQFPVTSVITHKLFVYPNLPMSVESVKCVFFLCLEGFFCVLATLGNKGKNLELFCNAST